MERPLHALLFLVCLLAVPLVIQIVAIALTLVTFAVANVLAVAIVAIVVPPAMIIFLVQVLATATFGIAALLVLITLIVAHVLITALFVTADPIVFVITIIATVISSLVNGLPIFLELFFAVMDYLRLQAITLLFEAPELALENPGKCVQLLVVLYLIYRGVPTLR